MSENDPLYSDNEETLSDETEKKPEPEKSVKKFVLCYKPYSLDKWLLLPGLFDSKEAALNKFSTYKIAGKTFITEVSLQE